MRQPVARKFHAKNGPESFSGFKRYGSPVLLYNFLCRQKSKTGSPIGAFCAEKTGEHILFDLVIHSGPVVGNLEDQETVTVI